MTSQARVSVSPARPATSTALDPGRCTPLVDISQSRVDPRTGRAHEGPASATVHLFKDFVYNQMYAVRVPPAGWTPAKATAAELTFYGFPKAPTDPIQRARWRQTLKNFRKFEFPRMCRSDIVYAPNSHSMNWAGIVNFNRTNYTEVHTVVKVPHTTSSCAGSGVGMWVGLGGYSSSRLLQNGLGDVSGTPNRWYAWFEELPLPAVTVSMTVSSGHRVFLDTWYNASAKSVWFTWSNQTNGSWAQVEKKGADKYYSGSSADIILERPFNGATHQLSTLRKWDSGAVLFEQSYAGVGTSCCTAVRSLPHYWYDMTNNAGNVVATTTTTALDNLFVSRGSAC